MSDVTRAVTCPECAERFLTAIIDLVTGELYCLQCRAKLPTAPVPDPRPAAVGERPDDRAWAAQVRSGRLKAILIEFNNEDIIKLWRLDNIWSIYDEDRRTGTIERQIRRYNETLRRLGAGFQLRYSRKNGALVRVPLEF